ncbi:Golgi-to-ER vesicle coat component [Microbotryomycetes sp. JL221]|nr:Golgi-to-ER vesicle coat component [Microbotryomycetes sp. JL221]
MVNLGLNCVTAVILLDSDSNRLLARYCSPAHADPKQQVQPFRNPFTTAKEQRAFELGIWEKTRRANGDILLYQNQLVLYKNSIDLTFYVVGPEGENELMLQGVLNAFYDAVSLLLRHQVEKRAILENLDLVVLALDETIDNSIILETDPIAIASRVSRPRPDAGVQLSDITINEQTIMQRSRTSEYLNDEEQEFDLVKFQAQIDESIAKTMSLVDSWTPKNVAATWNKASQNGAGSASSSLSALENSARPPRLGLGASASAYHAQQAEDRKLRNQLLGHARRHKSAEDEVPTNSLSGNKPTDGSAQGHDSSDDEEESRARSIKSKRPITEPFSSTSATRTIGKGPDREPARGLQPSLKTISPASFYGQPSNGAAHQQPLTKNQRKKERERMKKLVLQEAKLAEIRKEEQNTHEEQHEASHERESVGRGGDDSTGFVQTQSTSESSRTLIPPSKVTRPASSNDDSSNEAEEVSGALLPRPSPSSANTVDAGTNGGSPIKSDSNSTQANGVNSPRRRKKKRRKNKVDSTLPTPLLNLGTST